MSLVNLTAAATGNDDGEITPAGLASYEQRPPGPPKRVRRACDYCRTKRLKCTAEKRPCMNCQLYGSKCVWTANRGPKARGRTTNRTAVDQVAVSDTTIPDPQRAPTGHVAKTVGTGEPGGEESISVQSPAQRRLLHVDAADPSCPTSNAVLLSEHMPSAMKSLNTDTTYLSAFENVLLDVGIDLSPQFWDYDYLFENSNLPSENAAAEQLLTLPSPTATLQSTNPGSAFCPSVLNNQSTVGGNGEIFGADNFSTEPSGGVGAMSSGIFNRKTGGNSHFLGLTSTAAIFARCVREARETHHCLLDHEALNFIKDSGPLCDEITIIETSEDNGNDGMAQQVPSSTLAGHYIKVFFEDYYASYPIISQNEMDAILHRYMSHGPQGLPPLDRTILYLVTALGACSRRSTSTTNVSDFQVLYDLAWKLFAHAVATPSLASVQVLLLHVLYNIHWSKWGVAWVTCGLAVRVAQSMGLHLLPPQDLKLDRELLKRRSRLWAAVFILDAHLSLSQGKPPALHVSECDTDLFSNKRDLLQSPELHWPLSEIIVWRVSLAQIQQNLNECFASVLTSEERIRRLEAADLELMKWLNVLPIELRPDQQVELENDAHIEIYILHLDYFNLLQSIHWGLITRRPQDQIKEIPRFRASDSICLNACLALARTLNTMTDSRTRSRSFRSRTDHLLSAMAIVFRDILRNPSRMSARTNVEYLRVMKLHLDCITTGNLLASSLTKLIENMVESAEQVTIGMRRMPP
ncbi:hypothetical protein ACN47E_002488 [Coniothyrium glycines]